MKIEFTAFARASQGTGESRRMRRKGVVPGVVYGAGMDAQMIELDHHALFRHLRLEAFHASILDMSIDGAKQPVLLRDVQMHPWKQEVLHVDFQRVAKDRKIHMKVPLHFVNEATCPGVKAGGVISHVMTDIEVHCLPDDLPEFIEVDLGALELGHSVHAVELPLSKGVELMARVKSENPAIVLVQVPRQSAAEEAAAAAPTTEIISEKPGEGKDDKKDAGKKDAGKK
jgi:large subunit ribosomal protein L25